MPDYESKYYDLDFAIEYLITRIQQYKLDKQINRQQAKRMAAWLISTYLDTNHYLDEGSLNEAELFTHQ